MAKQIIAGFVFLCVACVIAAEPAVSVQEPEKTSSLLADTGPFSFEFGLTNIYQRNLRGGLSTNDGRGRFAGSYDVEMTADLKRLLGIDNAEIFTHVEGFWPRTEGIDPVSVGSFFGVNGDAMPRDAAVVTELWYQHTFFDGDLTIRAGKMDLTGGFECSGCPVSFDCNPYANDETQQFINSALVNNPTIPFPFYTLGLAAHYAPGNDWYITAASADSQGSYKESGFKTAFHDEDYFFYIAETGITPRLNSSRGPLQGLYAVGVWYLPEPSAVSVPEGEDEKYERDNTGVYASCGQMLVRENDVEDDTQGLGTFFRFGYAPSNKNDMTQFYSTGLSYQGLFDGRDNDVLAAGVARGYFSDRAAGVYTEDSETVFETFYNMEITRWMTLTPSIQYVANPSSADNERQPGDAVVFGLRAQMVF
jgi:carbohydrate-selective porin OprB